MFVTLRFSQQDRSQEFCSEWANPIGKQIYRGIRGYEIPTNEMQGPAGKMLNFGGCRL